jgi:hypothetical protein
LWDAFQYAFDGNMLTHTHRLAKSISERICWQDAFLHASVGARCIHPTLHITFWKLVSIRKSGLGY